MVSFCITLLYLIEEVQINIDLYKFLFYIILISMYCILQLCYITNQI